MTAEDLDIIVSSVAPVMREFVTSRLGALVERSDQLAQRLELVEQRAVIPGPDGAKGLDGVAGHDGKDGQDGKDGKDGTSVSLDDLLPVVITEVDKAVAAAAGHDGKDGQDGKDGKDGTSVSLDDLLPVVIAEVEKAVAAATPRLPEPVLIPADTDELAHSVEVLFRKELNVQPPMVRMQKRVIRDAHGKVERVVDEPATV